MFGLKFPQNTPEHAPSYYAATAHVGSRHPALDSAIEAEVAIVGGGFTGINTALELSERGYKVVLLEAHRVGWGASGRNGGQVIRGIGDNAEQFRRSIGEDGVRAIYDMGTECVDIVRERVARYNIDCDLRWGYCDVALKPRHLRQFEAARRRYKKQGYPHTLRMLDRSEIKHFVGSNAYIGGLYDATGGGHVHPMNLCLGEAAAAVDQGTRIFEQSRVLRLEQGARTTLFTDNGSVTAKNVVLCGNAYMANLVPKLASRVLPASSCIIATEPMSEDLARSVLPQNVAVCDPRTALDYFRLSRDNRLLFGGLSNYTGLVPANYKAIMRQKMLQIFPQLDALKIDYAWDGQLGVGLNRMPQLGKLGDKLYFIQGFAGHGVAATHIMARITAELINGETERFQTFSKIRHRPFPGGRYLRRPGLALGMLYFRALDRL